MKAGVGACVVGAQHAPRSQSVVRGLPSTPLMEHQPAFPTESLSLSRLTRADRAGAGTWSGVPVQRTL